MVTPPIVDKIDTKPTNQTINIGCPQGAWEFACVVPPSVYPGNSTLQGGATLISVGTPDPTDDDDGTGTALLVMRNSTNHVGVITAAHVVNQVVNSGVYLLTVDSTRSQITQNWSLIGNSIQFANTNNPDSDSFIDAAFIHIENPDLPYLTNVILGKNNQTLTVVEKGGVDAQKNKPIEIAGVFNDSTGFVKYTNVTAIIDGYVLKEQVMGDYGSRTGDSGAPVFQRIGDDTVRLLGLHNGKACNAGIHDPDGQYTYHYSPCGGNHLAPYKIFTKWEDIASSLNLE